MKLKLTQEDLYISLFGDLCCRILEKIIAAASTPEESQDAK
jgi:hypothetical protein